MLRNISFRINGIANTKAMRTERLQGREHIVVPIIALQEMVVLPGNMGGQRQLVLESELRKTAVAWNGRPLVFNHPKINGRETTAGIPEHFDTVVFGTVFASRVDDKKLKVEGWIDVERVKILKNNKLDKVIENIKLGKTVEVSVGAFAQDEEAPGTFKGEKFDTIWRNIVPDHLAILEEGAVGACSVEAGCGVPRTNSGQPSDDPAGAGDPSAAGDPSPALKAACSCETNSPAAVLGQSVLDELGVKANQTDQDIRMALAAALRAADPKGFTAVMAVLSGKQSFVYVDFMSGKMLMRGFRIANDGMVTLVGDPQWVRPVTDFVPVKAEVKTMKRNERIEKLAAHVAKSSNKPDFKYSDADIAALKAMPKESFDFMCRSLGAAEIAALAEEAEANATQANASTTHAPSAQQPTQVAAQTPAPAAAPSALASVDPNAIDRAVNERLNQLGIKPHGTPLTLEQYIAAAPAELRPMLQRQLAYEKALKARLVETLLKTNRCQWSKEQLEAMDITMLENMATLAAVPDFSGQGLPSVPSLAAASGHPNDGAADPMPSIWDAPASAAKN